MEDRCSFTGFVVAYGRFIWFYWLQTMLKFNVVLDLCFPRPTSGKWQKLDLFISTIIADIWTKVGLHKGIPE